MYFLLPYSAKHKTECFRLNAHVFFCYVWMSLERKTFTLTHVVNISFIMAVSKFLSVDEMKELVIVKNLR